MRLAFLADASLGHTVRWVNEFAARRHHCLLLSVERGAGIQGRVEWLPSHPSLPRFARYSLNVRRARALLRDFNPDVVNPHFLPNYGWIAALAGLRPLVLTTLGSDILVVPGRTPLHAWRTRFVLSRCDAVISDALVLTEAIRRFDVSAEKILTVPMGIETGRFDRTRPRPDGPPCVVLGTRRLEPIYDVDTILRGFEHLNPEERAQFELRLAGGGSQETALRARGEPLGVRFLGWLGPAQLDVELEQAHLYVSASLSDSTSVSLLEAMAAGCLPIVSDIPANREWVIDGENGLLFACGDAAALAVCLRRAADDLDLRRQAARLNRDLVTRRASWESNMSEVEDLFARLAPRISAPKT